MVVKGGVAHAMQVVAETGRERERLSHPRRRTHANAMAQPRNHPDDATCAASEAPNTVRKRMTVLGG